jgi:hypothetical protein
VGYIHYESHYKGWALKSRLFLGPEMATSAVRAICAPKSRDFRARPLKMSQVMDIARPKIIKSKRHKKMGTLVFLCTLVFFNYLGFFGLCPLASSPPPPPPPSRPPLPSPFASTFPTRPPLILPSDSAPSASNPQTRPPFILPLRLRPLASPPPPSQQRQCLFLGRVGGGGG